MPKTDIFYWPGGGASVEGCQALGGKAERLHGLGHRRRRPRLLWVRSQAGADAPGEDPSFH